MSCCCVADFRGATITCGGAGRDLKRHPLRGDTTKKRIAALSLRKGGIWLALDEYKRCGVAVNAAAGVRVIGEPKTVPSPNLDSRTNLTGAAGPTHEIYYRVMEIFRVQEPAFLRRSKISGSPYTAGQKYLYVFRSALSNNPPIYARTRLRTRHRHFAGFASSWDGATPECGTLSYR